jgi:hypothetical protein
MNNFFGSTIYNKRKPEPEPEPIEYYTGDPIVAFPNNNQQTPLPSKRSRYNPSLEHFIFYGIRAQDNSARFDGVYGNISSAYIYGKYLLILGSQTNLGRQLLQQTIIDKISREPDKAILQYLQNHSTLDKLTETLKTNSPINIDLVDKCIKWHKKHESSDMDGKTYDSRPLLRLLSRATMKIIITTVNYSENRSDNVDNILRNIWYVDAVEEYKKQSQTPPSGGKRRKSRRRKSKNRRRRRHTSRKSRK